MPLLGGESIPVVKQPSAAAMAPAPFIMLSVANVLSSPFQSRIAYEDPEINELVETIKQHGVLEPILVRPKNDRFEVVAGHRRLRAAKQAQLTSIPAIVKPLSDQEAFEIHFIENLQRKDLTDTEKGRMLLEMTKRYPEAYPTQEVLAYKIGKSQEWVSRLIRMAEIIEQDINIKRLIMLKPGASVEEISAFIHVEPVKRGEAVDQIRREIESGHVPSVRETKAIVEPVVERQIDEQPQAPEHIQDLKGEAQIIRRKFDVWNIAGIDLKKPFGDPSYPGAIPGDIVGNVLLWFLPDGGKIVDPMAGGGVTEDVCKFLGSDKYQCLLFDSKRLPNYKYRESIRFNDIATGSLPLEAESVDLVFADPPYGPLKEYGMNVEDLKRVIEGLAQASYKVLKLKGKVAVLMQNHYEGGECTGKFIGLVRQTAEIFEKSGFTQIFEVTVPLYGKVPRNEATMTHIDRRLMVFQK